MSDLSDLINTSERGPAPARALPRPHAFALGLVRALARLSFRSRWWLAGALARASLRHDALLREVLATNLTLCLAELPPARRAELQQRNAHEMFFALLDRFRLWSLPADELAEQVSLVNAALLHRLVGTRPMVLMCPHFLGLEAAAQRLTLEVSGMTLYRPSRSAAFEAMRCAARRRFGDQRLYSTRDPLLPMIRRLRAGTPLFLLPDLDDGSDGAVFSPFFGVAAATTPLTAWCAQRAGAAVLPVSVRRADRGRYVVTVHEPLAPPGGDAHDAARSVNAAVEALVREAPDQYWWAQPRFATRPAGARPIYSAALLRHAREAFGSAP